jgi:hypothetical protein
MFVAPARRVSTDPPFFAGFLHARFLDRVSGLLEAKLVVSIEVIAGQ